MKKTTKTILIVSACFMGAGILAAAAGTTAAVIWKRKKRAAEEEVLYELDGPSEDE